MRGREGRRGPICITNRTGTNKTEFRKSLEQMTRSKRVGAFMGSRQCPHLIQHELVLENVGFLLGIGLDASNKVRVAFGHGVNQ